MTAVDADDVAAQIEVIQAKARRRMLRLLPVYAVLGGIGALSSRVLDTPHRHHHSSLVRGIIVLVVACVLIAVVLVVVKRRRGRLFPESPLGLGLTRSQRREMKRDLRCGRPSADPVLAEVERRTAERVLRQSRFNAWVFPIYVVIASVNIALPDRTVLGRTFFAVLLVVVIVAWPFQIRHLRRLRAFPR